jgi:hypothetical protein
MIVKERFSPLNMFERGVIKGFLLPFSDLPFPLTPSNKFRGDRVGYRSKGVGLMVDWQGEVITPPSPPTLAGISPRSSTYLSVIKFTPINYLKPPIEPYSSLT